MPNFVEKNHINPTNQTIYSKKLYSQNIKVGNYKIKQSQINLMRNKKIEILDNEDYSINFKDLNVKKGEEETAARIIQMNDELKGIMARTGVKNLSQMDSSVIHKRNF